MTPPFVHIIAAAYLFLAVLYVDDYGLYPSVCYLDGDDVNQSGWEQQRINFVNFLLVDGVVELNGLLHTLELNRPLYVRSSTVNITREV